MLSLKEYYVLKIVADRSDDIYTNLEQKDIVTASKLPECDTITLLNKLAKQGLIVVVGAEKYGINHITITYEGQSKSIHQIKDVTFEVLGHFVLPLAASAFFSVLFSALFALVF